MVMGILNVTPDSFADGGRYLEVEAAVERAVELVQAGAEVIDIGGESTRPGAAGVSEAEELRRVLPVIQRVAAVTAVPISIDTVKPAVARAALAAGASIVNDVAANRADQRMWREVAECGAGYVCVHMRGTPQTMQVDPQYADVVKEVNAFFADRLERLSAFGVNAAQVVLDVGIGFGKTLDHNLALLAALGGFITLGRPLLLGVSRKSFIGKLFGVGVEARLPASLACACQAVTAGVHLVRAHDVAETVQAVRMTEALLARQDGKRP
jgi:dihydropteroate synthase